MTADDYRIYCDLVEDEGLLTELLRLEIERLLSQHWYGHWYGSGYGNGYGDGNGDGYGD